MKIYLRKYGKNVQIAFDPTETTQPDFYEDSANVEVYYNTKNNTVTVTIQGTGSFYTTSITASNQLYMNSAGTDVLINSKVLFDTNYPLVFPSGGSGSTPTLGQVVTAGNSFDDDRIVGNDNTNNTEVTVNADGINEPGFYILDGAGNPYDSKFTRSKLIIQRGTNPALYDYAAEYAARRLFMYDNIAAAPFSVEISADTTPKLEITNIGTAAHSLGWELPTSNVTQTMPKNSGDIALQDPPNLGLINLSSSNYTPNVDENCIIIINAVGSGDLVLDSSTFADRKTLTLLVRAKPFTVTSSSVIWGSTNVNSEGLFYITYVNSEFFLSHI